MPFAFVLPLLPLLIVDRHISCHAGQQSNSPKQEPNPAEATRQRARNIHLRAADLRRRNRAADADALEQAFLSNPSSVSLADPRFALKRKGSKSKRAGRKTPTKTPIGELEPCVFLWEHVTDEPFRWQA